MSGLPSTTWKTYLTLLDLLNRVDLKLVFNLDVF